ncbi:MAG TPA: penicillin acylase family protein, partial [Solimonas sp.]|nr:penicillin acylase family protein [Solimonas sp.]
MKWIQRISAAILLLLLLGALSLYAVLRRSLPQLDGDLSLSGLRAPVQVQRDALGVPTLTAADRLDLARATGWLHAQDRYFQMDLNRRAAAGELSELVGASALPLDRGARLHRLRKVAQQIVAAAAPEERALLDAYSAGVNAGLRALRSKPFEYWLLAAEPQDWRPEDTVLSVLSMWLQLTDEAAEREAMLHAMREALPPELYAFIAQPGSPWDAPLEGSVLPQVPVPGSTVYDLRTLKKLKFRREDLQLSAADAEAGRGSNAWAVAGAHTADGGALVADDMHLGLGVPSSWYRMRLRLQGPQPLDISGVTLPGTPFVIAGSNGHVAWGFTNSYGDWSDLVLLDPAPRDRSRYRTPQGYEPFELHAERLLVRGDDDVIFNIRTTLWGPVVGKDVAGRDLVVHWLGAQPAATNLRLAWLEQARSVEEAIAVAQGAGLPPQNFVVADRAGHIGWTIAGRIPLRDGHDPNLPASWADGGGWNGWLPQAQYPRRIDPPLGRLWTANARLVEGEELSRLGDGGYEFGARAQQIRGTLLSLPAATPEDMLQVQLDDRALFLSRWQPLLMQALEGLQQAGGNHEQALAAVRAWGGRAATDSVGYRMVREFHDLARERAFDAITAICRKRDPDFHKAYLRQ